MSQRNPRRRQRKDFDDGGSIRSQPQRKRSRISQRPDGPLPDHETNGNIDYEQDPDGANRDSLEIPLRHRHQPARRPSKEHGSTILAQNSQYLVSRLPNIPEQLRENGIACTASFLPSHFLVLALTRHHAYIWNYTSTSFPSSIRSFSLTFGVSDSDPLPLGSLVAAGSSSQVGLVTLHAKTGKITYWDNVENADAFNLFEKKRNGLESSCGQLGSGETIVGLEDTGHAGYMISFSSGRIAQLLLRDPQSRPSISVRFLSATNNAGLLGTIKSVFGAGKWLKSVAAVHSKPATNHNAVSVLIADHDGRFQAWRASWTGQPIHEFDVDAQEQLQSAVAGYVGPEATEPQYQLNLIDFAWLHNRDTHRISVGDEQETQSFRLLVLAALDMQDVSRLYLIELSLTNENATAGFVIWLQACPPSRWVTTQPHLHVPSDCRNAYVILENAITISQLAHADDDVLQGNTMLNGLFQDTIYLRDPGEMSICGVSALNPSLIHDSGLLAYISSSGVVRVLASEATSGQIGNDTPKITVKERIEQQVYYGSSDTNPLDLARVVKDLSPVSDVEEAAIDISREILGSDSPLIGPATASMKAHLAHRASLLKNLALLLNRTRHDLSRVTKWKLLWDAEKLAAAQNLWDLYDATVENVEGYRARLLPMLLPMINSQSRTKVQRIGGERDPVRQWFLKDVWRMENLIAWPNRALGQLETDERMLGAAQRTELLSDANDVVLGCLIPAFEFRTANLKHYGLLNEAMTEDILQNGYEGLPEIWTSVYIIVHELPPLFFKLRDHAVKEQETFEREDGERVAVEELPLLLQKVIKESARLIHVYCKCYEERCLWYNSRESEADQSYGREARAAFENTRYKLLTLLPVIGSKEGMELAEKFRDMRALVELVEEAKDLCSEDVVMSLASRKATKATSALGILNASIARYFANFGEEWSSKYFSRLIKKNEYATLLDYAQSQSDALETFLHQDSANKKLSWITDIFDGQKTRKAAKSLIEIANYNELKVWSKKVELALGKLALVASEKPSPNLDEELDIYQKRGDAGLELVRIQESIYAHMDSTLYNATDAEAKFQLAKETYATLITDGRPSFQTYLERCLELILKRIVLSGDQLVETLTLIDLPLQGGVVNEAADHSSDSTIIDIVGREFILALRVLRCAKYQYAPAQLEMITKYIWRRCMIRDDWHHINETGISDKAKLGFLSSTTLFRTILEGTKSGMWNEETMNGVPTARNVLGAACSLDDLDYKLGPGSDLRGPFLKDIVAEDAKLQQLIDSCALEHWVEAVKDLVHQSLKQEREAEEKRHACVRKVEQELHDGHETLKEQAEVKAERNPLVKQSLLGWA